MRVVTFIPVLFLSCTVLGCADKPPDISVFQDESTLVQVGTMADLTHFSESIMMQDRHIRSYAGGWMFYPEEVLATITAHPRYLDNLDVLLKARNELARYGMEYLVILVPGTSVIYPDILNPDHPMTEEGLPYRVDLHRLKLFAAMDKEGIDYLDLTPAYIRARLGDCTDSRMRANTHWSNMGRVIAARSAADWIRAHMGGSVPQTALKLSASWEKKKLSDVEPALQPLQEANGVADSALEQLAWCRTVRGWSNDVPGTVVQVTGDSNTMQEDNSGGCFAAQLAYELNADVSTIGAYGNWVFGDMATEYRTRPRDFMCRKVVVHVVSTRTYCLYDQDYYPVFPSSIDVKELRSMPNRANNTEPVTVQATCTKISSRRTLVQLKPYDSALTCALFKVDKVIDGTCSSEEIAIASWSFIANRETTWKYLMMTNDTYRFRLEPFSDHPYLKKQASDFDALEDKMDAPLYWCVDFRLPGVNETGRRSLFVISTDTDMLTRAKRYAERRMGGKLSVAGDQ